MLESGVMEARMLLSDGHIETVAHVCNYFCRPYTFKAAWQLPWPIAEPVVHITGADGRAVVLSLATSSGLSVSEEPNATT